MFARIGAITVLYDQRRRPYAFEQFENIADRVVAVKRRAADRAVTRAGKQRHHALDPAWQPDGYAFARFDASLSKIGGKRIRGAGKLKIGHTPMAVAHGK